MATLGWLQKWDNPDKSLESGQSSVIETIVSERRWETLPLRLGSSYASSVAIAQP